MTQKFIEKMTGYKATNADMTCKGFQFELGKWYEIDGEIELCKRGFHFCVHPSGPWCYYDAPGTRVFKIEAEQILELPVEAGADFKLVAKKIRLVEEITLGGHWNTGDRNTGHRNTGDRNTGDWNTGHGNTGHGNTGHRNTGDRNTGHGNTGHRNTGDRNTGDWNTTNNSSGFFCSKEPKVISFDVQTNLTREQYFGKYPEAYRLGELLVAVDVIPFAEFKNIPGITKAKLKKLHEQHLAARKMA